MKRPVLLDLNSAMTIGPNRFDQDRKSCPLSRGKLLTDTSIALVMTRHPDGLSQNKDPGGLSGKLYVLLGRA